MVLHQGAKVETNHSSSDHHSIVFVDAKVLDYTVLVNKLQPRIAVYVLPESGDGVEYITRTLEQYPCRGEAIAHIHIISHGFPGGLYLGNAELTLRSLQHYADDLGAWFSDFRCQHRYLPPTPSTPSSPQLLLYGCHVAAGDAGAEFLKKLQKMTGAALQASTQAIGNPNLGGALNLNVGLGQTIKSAALAPKILATCTDILTPMSLT